MAETRSSIDTSRLEKMLAKLPGQVPFAIATTLTALAKDGQAAAEKRINEAFDRPVPFTQRSIGIITARKDRLVSAVFVKDLQAAYLRIEETGGTRRPEPGKPINVPVQIRTNVSGNIPRGAIKREIAKPTTFVSGQDTPGTANLPPGIYQRYKAGRRGKARAPKLLISFKKQARYQPIFKFKATVREAVLRMVEQRWRENIAKAIETARR